MLPENNNQNNTISNNLKYIDFLRVFAAIMVIILHAVSDYYLDSINFETRLWWVFTIVNEICRTGVPLFFMITGYLMLSKSKIVSIKDFYKKRIFKILIPFLIWDIIYYCYYRCINNLNIFDVAFFDELLLTGSAYHLWYVYSLIFLYLLLPFIKIITDKCSLKLQILFLFLVILQTTVKPFINIVTWTYFYFAPDGFIGYLGYMLLGNILGKFDFKKSTRIVIYILGLAGAALGIIGNYLYSVENGFNLIFNGGYMLNHFLFAGAIFVFFKYAVQKANPSKNNFISKLSTLTLTVYFVHVLPIEIAKEHFYGLAPSTLALYKFLIALFASFIIAYIIESFKKIIFYRRKEV